jgi:CheY-specific phosphatase CheX
MGRLVDSGCHLERKFVIDEDLLVRSVTEATTEVFSTMLDMGIRFTGLAGDARAPELGIISLVGITGDWGGSGVFCCSPVLAAVLCSRMLGTELIPGAPSIDEEVLDVVAEITNMSVGNIKNGLEPITGPLAISVPTVIHGRNFEFRNSAGLRGAALKFEADDQAFEVRISLAPTAEQAGVRSRIPILGLAHT